MDKKQRQVVHEIARAVNLKSESRGKGHSRFPTLYRTGRTLHFDSNNISVLSDAFTPRRTRLLSGGVWNERVEKNRDAGPRAARQNGAVSYSEGDVVGGTAPVLSANNKGRAMLEKMGWTAGTALGATNNKGILQPVTHVVRNSRAGLG
jgi:hypothetical protein